MQRDRPARNNNEETPPPLHRRTARLVLAKINDAKRTGTEWSSSAGNIGGSDVESSSYHAPVVRGSNPVE